MDSAIHQINLFPLDSAIGFPGIYPLDSDFFSLRWIALSSFSTTGAWPVLIFNMIARTPAKYTVTISNLPENLEKGFFADFLVLSYSSFQLTLQNTRSKHTKEPKEETC